MKTNQRSFLSDLKAAVRIGHPEAIEMALYNLRAWPYVASNDHLPPGFIKRVIHPAARTLSRRPASELALWSDQPLTAYRALAAASLAYRYLQVDDVDPKLLHRAANDNRAEVRLVVGQALSTLEGNNPSALRNLAEAWLQDNSPKVRATALGFIPYLTASSQQQIVDWLQPLGTDSHEGVRAALVQALKTLADIGHADIVLGLLGYWVSTPHPNVWLITRSVSGSWAVSHPKDIRAILMELQSKTRGNKEISNALNALQRHGMQIDLEQ
ncbi:MAG: HEAT repeat domain-containing protein [Chloroflexi bacterium]|nr:HEAT repeat domain-containing protein [Chloroflexota bacterium]